VRRGRSGLTDPLPSTEADEVFLAEDVRFEAGAVLRQAAFAGSSSVRHRSDRKGARPSLPVFSPAVRHAVYAAIDEASRQGVEHPGPRHLLPALLAVPGNAAARLAAQWVPAQALEQMALGNWPDGISDPAPWRVVDTLIAWRILPTSGPRLWRPLWRAGIWAANKVLFQRAYRRYGARYGHPLLSYIEADATENAVRIGKDRVTAAHVMLSLVEFHEELAAAGKALPDEVGRWNRAGAILAAHGVQAHPALLVAVGLAAAPADAEDQIADVPTEGWWPREAGLAAPAQGRTALTALREASLSAYRRGHPYAGTTHLLATLLAEPDGPAARLLRELGADPDTLRSEAVQLLEGVEQDDR
jgi:hypothetical protein